MTTRRLAAILAADVVGYSRLVGADEPGTLSRLSVLRHDVIELNITRHSGRLFKVTLGERFVLLDRRSARQGRCRAIANV